MGKSGKKKDAAKAAATARCTCDDPYKCTCGNRPERPSKGHKWYPDEQIWAGKGHKQKGASGQTASVSQKDTVTTKGQTQVAQWQRLPSQLLAELCQRQKRPRPKYKNIEKNRGVFKYRVIVCDPKDDASKDLFFVPAHSVANEEQAKEEGALLALLQLTPTLPHERKLPEPYRTTWLNAIAAAKQKNEPKKDTSFSKNVSSSNTAPRSSIGGETSNNSKTGVTSISSKSTAASAKASSSLTLGTHVSQAAKRQHGEAKRRARNAKIRKHDAIRMANQNHPVFMSAKIRTEIETLLRGESGNVELLKDNNNNDADDDDQVEEADNAAQASVERRLHSEAFTKRQARMAYTEMCKTNQKFQKIVAATANDDDDKGEELWDELYEECLQWLLVHLNEDQLPVGFDPREGTLDVVVPSSSKNKKEKRTGSDDDGAHDDNKDDSAAVVFATQYGIQVQEARLIAARAKTFEQTFWNTILAAAKVSFEEEQETTHSYSSEEMRELAKDELEALDAIFPSECKVESSSTGGAEQSGFSTIQIALEGGTMSLHVVVEDGVYPGKRPRRVFVTGTWPKPLGTALHIEIVKFMASELAIGEPMIFAIHGHVQELLQSSNELTDDLSLLPVLGEADTGPSKSRSINTTSNSRKEQQEQKSIENPPVKKVPQHRPRDRRRNFWTLHPRDTSPADASPKVSSLLERTRKNLPAASARKDFLAAMKESESTGGRVLLVTGETGSGKSTQLPAYILEDNPKGAKIVVAQPRRLAATGVATRVAEERGERNPGTDSVGYVVRGDSAICNRSRLVFCTTGVLLRQLQNEGALDCITHIVVDEVHERSLDSDVLLGLLKQKLSSYRHLRVVLMSATLDTERFANYWGGKTPHIHIPGRTFPVTDFMLEDVLSLTGYIPSKNKKKGKKTFKTNNRCTKSSPWNDSEWSDDEEDIEAAAEDGQPSQHGASTSNGAGHGIPIADLVKRVDETSLDVDLIARLVKHLIVNKYASDDGSILVFLSGAPEINSALETIKRVTKGLPVMLLPLHGGLQPKEQSRVFQSAPRGSTKVICSTNVAETSITIPDCTIVIDVGREKQSSYDPINRMPLLLEQFASKASMKQRRGRAGRVREGTCYKLVSRSTYASLNEHSEPEIRRVALDQTLLQLLFLGVETGSGTFMKTLLDPPAKDSIDAATYSLRKLGAVEPGTNEGDLNLTPLGAHLAGIPAPPVVGKMLVMGSILGCREAALAMAAGISVGRSPFLRIDAPRNKRNNTEDERSGIEQMKQENILKERASYIEAVGNSDHALIAAIYLKWKAVGTGGGLRKRFCDSLGLSFNGMRDLFQLVKQLDSSLVSAGFPDTPESNCNMRSWRIIHACAVSAMAPSQLVKVRRPATKYQETAEGAKEKDGEARELKFFIRTDSESESKTGQWGDETRVFIHPASINFSNGNYSCPFLVYNSMVRTSKPFLRDVTECSAYALLLFGGELEIKVSKGVIAVDGWAELAANARIGSLMGGLRRKVDALLSEKVKNPSFNMAASREMLLIVKLIMTDGLGT